MRNWLLAGAIALSCCGAVGLELPTSRDALAQTVDARKTEADRLRQQGREQFQANQFEAASQSWQQALKLYREINDRAGEGRVLHNLGLIYASFGNYLKAIEFYETSLLISREISDQSLEGIALGNLGNAYGSLGNYPKAIDYLEQFLAIVRKSKDRQSEGKVLADLGAAYASLSNYAKAIEYYQQVLAIVRESKDRHGEVTVLNYLGIAYAFLDNYAKFIEYEQQALVIAREIKDRQGEGGILSNLGRAYRSLGNYAKAIEYHQQALVIARESKDRGIEAHTLNYMGSAYYALGNYAKAIEYHQQALAIARESKGRQDEGSILSYLGLAYSSLGNYAKAIEYHQQALAIAHALKNSRNEGHALGNLGIAYDSLGNYAKAIEYHQQALAIARKINAKAMEAMALNNIGTILSKQQQPELAIVFYKQSVNVRESIRTTIQSLSQELQQSYAQTVAGTYRALADLLLAQGRVLEAQQVLELLKIQELRDYTRDTRGGSPTSGSPLNPLEKPIPTAFEDKIALGNQLTQCEQTKCAQRAQLITQRDAANDKFTALVDRLKKALREQEIKDPAQLHNNEFTRAAQDVILANPKTKTVLIYPLVLDDKLWLVWGAQAGKSGIVFDSKAIPVSRKDLSAKIGELQTLLSQRGDINQLQQVSQQLYQWLIAPIRQQLDENSVQQIVFSLDRATRYIPMAALYDGKHYLVEIFAISTILTAQTDTNDILSANIQENPVLGLGLTQAVPGFSALSGVKAELDGIIRLPNPPADTKGIYPGLKLLDRDFTETALRQNVSDYRILHIATHGQFVPGTPEDSFLVLGDGKKLSIPTIRSMTALANTHLVVLSACETGKGGIDKEGLEVAGIGHYFLLSGAKSVMASLWLVNDPATSLLMQQFYTNLATGKHSKAESLRQVQLDFIHGDLTTKDTRDRAGARRHAEGQLPVESLAHPYYWAPFILIGNSL